jgi:hypothetical protein
MWHPFLNILEPFFEASKLNVSKREGTNVRQQKTEIAQQTKHIIPYSVSPPNQKKLWLLLVYCFHNKEPRRKTSWVAVFPSIKMRWAVHQ